MNFNWMKESDTPNTGGEESHNLENKNENYPSAGNARNICFEMLDGGKKFFSYSYLICGEFNPHQDQIVLHFTSHFVELQGKNMKGLFKDFCMNKPKNIKQVEERYIRLLNQETYVIEIKINEK